MKLLDLVETEKKYNAQIKVVSRGNSRKGSFSTKQVRERIKKLGFSIRGASSDKPDNQLIQIIEFSGTRDEIIEARKKITTSLRIMSSNSIPTQFSVKEA